MSMFDYQVTNLISPISCFRMSTDLKQTSIVIYHVSTKTTYLYKINPYCQLRQFFNKSSKICINCMKNC